MLLDMPYLGDIPDGRWLNDTVQGLSPVLIVIEKQQAMPGQGVTSMMSIGMGYGSLVMWATLLNVPFITPRPAAWKQRLGVTRDKASSVTMASRLFPEAGLYGPRGGAKDGRAEALLLAEYGRRWHLGLIAKKSPAGEAGL